MGFMDRLYQEQNVTFDLHTEPHYDVTPGQVTFFMIWIGCFILWLAQFLGFVDLSNDKAEKKEKQTPEMVDNLNQTLEKKKEQVDQNETPSHVSNSVSAMEEGKTKTSEQNGAVQTKPVSNKNITTVKPTPSSQDFLLKVLIFGVILTYFYLCDYRKIFPKSERVYNRDRFLFLVFLFFLVASVFTIKPTPDKILNRDQTEEWKGWMQVMFVWYHMFAAKEWYNWIRVYIAAYVWMTGFGNFSFFWVRKDFSLWRFLKMQFRLNFLVTCLCVVTNNEYMLYYICAMHSYWFISVYVFMGMLNSWNTDRIKMAVKFVMYFIFNALIFEVDVITNYIFRPFRFILEFHMPNYDPMHEWAFRAGLDHWACFVGMLCAYNYPLFETFMKNIEKSENVIRCMTIKVIMILLSVAALCLWYFSFMRQDKFSYNKIHPYTSTIPIICFIVIRNSFPVLRQHHVSMFAWLGKITLETYLSQLHVYLQSNAKDTIRYLPKGYPLLNFAFATIVYLIISHKLFDLTTDFSAYLIPKDMRVVFKHFFIIAVLFAVPRVFLSFSSVFL